MAKAPQVIIDSYDTSHRLAHQTVREQQAANRKRRLAGSGMAEQDLRS
jgi:hypothetical protein